MSGDGSEAPRGLKGRVLEELKAYWIITLYLWLFLGCFTVYRRLVLAETGVPYMHYGIALVEAMVIAKVILIGRVFGFSRRFDEEPLIVPVVYKSVLFALLVMLFGVAERLVVGWIHEQTLAAGLHAIEQIGADEIGARALMLTVALIPFVAFSELSRVMGRQRLQSLFLTKEVRPAGDAA